MDKTPLLSKTQVGVRLLAIIAGTEFLIMLVLGASSYVLNVYIGAILDVVLLALLAAPAIYLWVIRPFVEARDTALAYISQQAATDPLTNLVNRRVIYESLARMTTFDAPAKSHGAVLIIDLDQFKCINDDYGHEAGDAVLVQVAHRMKATLRAGDVAGRFGGDEFVVLLSRLGSDQRSVHDGAQQVAEKLIEAISQPIDVGGQRHQVRASVGIRLLGFDDVNSATAMHEADVAMYRAKAAGGNQAVVFRP